MRIKKYESAMLERELNCNCRRESGEESKKKKNGRRGLIFRGQVMIVGGRQVT